MGGNGLMKTLSKKICVVLAVLAALCFGMMALLTFTPAEASAAVEGYATTDFKMLDKGSIRKNADSNGIRFATFIGEESEQVSYDFENEYELGTLFLPKAAMEAGDELTIDGTYKNGVKAIAAVFDGNMDNLTTDETYTGGLLFNAVLELSDFTGNANALNGKIVARTYVKKIADGSVSYCDAVERAPAYVAAMALGANEEDTNETLSSYVQYVEVDAPDVINVGSWYALNKWGEGTALPTLNVEGLEVEYSAETGNITTAQAYGGTPVPVDLIKIEGGKMYGLNEGDTRLVLSAANGAITKYVNVTISLPQVTFVGNSFTPDTSAIFTVRAADVATVKYNGELLVKDTDYTYDATSKIITIKKHDVIDYSTLTLTANADCNGTGTATAAFKQDNVLEITTNGGAVSTVPVYVRQATRVDWANMTGNNINELVLLEGRMQQFNIGDLRTETVNKYGHLFVARTGGADVLFYVNINSEFVRSFKDITTSKYPNMWFKWTVDGNFTGERTVGYIDRIEDGVLKYSQYITNVTVKGDKSCNFKADWLPGCTYGDQVTTADTNIGYRGNLGTKDNGISYFGIGTFAINS